jgi:hypothetical protein
MGELIINFVGPPVNAFLERKASFVKWSDYLELMRNKGFGYHRCIFDIIRCGPVE